MLMWCADAAYSDGADAYRLLLLLLAVLHTTAVGQCLHTTVALSLEALDACERQRAASSAQRANNSTAAVAYIESRPVCWQCGSHQLKRQSRCCCSKLEGWLCCDRYCDRYCDSQLSESSSSSSSSGSELCGAVTVI
jgi:hypothetical protein